VSAYLEAFLQGHLSGLSLWLAWSGVVLLGIAIAGVIVLACVALADWSVRHWPGDLDSDDMGGRP
jgi:hypothetical protein